MIIGKPYLKDSISKEAAIVPKGAMPFSRRYGTVKILIKIIPKHHCFGMIFLYIIQTIISALRHQKG